MKILQSVPETSYVLNMPETMDSFQQALKEK
jgi:hypothetical protein